MLHTIFAYFYTGYIIRNVAYYVCIYFCWEYGQKCKEHTRQVLLMEEIPKMEHVNINPLLLSQDNSSCLFFPWMWILTAIFHRLNGW